MGLPDSSVGKESACNAGDLGLIPGLRRTPGEGKGHPLQYSGLENSMDCKVHGVAKSRTRLSNFHFHFFQEFWCKAANLKVNTIALKNNGLLECEVVSNIFPANSNRCCLTVF